MINDKYISIRINYIILEIIWYPKLVLLAKNVIHVSYQGISVANIACGHEICELCLNNAIELKKLNKNKN